MSAENNKTQIETLNRLLKVLSSGIADQQMEAMRELWTLNYSSQAILIQLEKIVISASADTVRQAALDLIDSKIHKHVRSQANKVSDSSRALLLNEIRLWVTDGLIENKIAFVLTRRYAFDKMPVKLPPAEAEAPKVSAAPVAAAVPVAVQVKVTAPAPSPVRVEAPKPAMPAAPRPTLMQTLLSETSIKVALYFGAFLVIASALILAALNEQARLPVLLVVTALFAVGAFALKKRLPQPSFALFIVFSFLLPINGNVLADTLKITGTAGHIFWTVNFLFMASVWALSVWLYDSWFFSIASLASIGLALMRASMIFGADNNAKAFTVSLTALIGLAVVYLFKKWKDDKFALPVFLCVQAVQAILLLVSFMLFMFNLVNGATAWEWFFAALTWLGAAVLYVSSPYLFDIPKISFAFPAAASITLLPIMGLVLQIFHPSTETITIGQIIWGALIATFSEIAFRQNSTKIKSHNLPLLGASLITFFAAIIFGGSAGITYFFAATLITSLTYIALMFIRPRFYIWIFALLAALGAYFAFFSLPFMDSAHVPTAYQLLGATLLLLTPELFFKAPFTFKDSWRWPAFVIGTILLLVSWTDVLSETNLATRAIVLAVYAILVMAHSVHFKHAFIGYFATTSLMFSVGAAMSALNLDNQLHVAWTGLAVAYYLAGILLKRRTASWSAMMRTSGLALGIIASTLTLVTVEHFGGWFILIIGLMFTAEMFTHPSGFFEPASLVLFSAATYLFMRDAHVEQFGYHLLAHSIIWLGGDMLFAQTFKARKLQMITLGVGAIITFVNLTLLAGMLIETNPLHRALIFGVYAILLMVHGIYFKRAFVGYFSTASLMFSIGALMSVFKLDNQLHVAWTVLAVAYYAAGILLKRRTASWSEMMRNSGLALGIVASVFTFATVEHFGGWFILIIGLMFVAEMFIRVNGLFEPIPLIFFSAATYLFMRDLHVNEVGYHLLAQSLLWLGGDMLFARTFMARKLQWITRGIGAIIALVNFILLAFPFISASFATMICFAVYAAFFALYAWFYRQPKLGYAATTSLALFAYFTLVHLKVDAWLPVLTALAVAYYSFGFLLKSRASSWGEMLRFSALALASIVSFAAFFALKHTGGWYALIAGILFIMEMRLHNNDEWLEPAPLAHFSIASFLLLHDFNITSYPYIFLASALVWLGGDMIFHKIVRERKLAWPVRGIGIFFVLAMIDTLFVIDGALIQSDALQSTICFGILSVFFAVYAWMYQKPVLGYASTISLMIAVYFATQYAGWGWSPIPLTVIAIIYYAAGYVLRRTKKADGWDSMLWTSGMGLGILLSILAPLHIEFVSSIPVAMTATFIAFEAFHRRNVWLGFPANLLYLESYFIVLGSLRVDQPQFFSIGIAALGMVMHYLLTRAGSNRAAFLTGMFSQVVLLGTSYIQMVSTQNLGYFAVIFFQALAVLTYGIVSRSRSLLLAPIAFSVLATMTVIYKIVKDLGTVVLVGCTGIVLLLLGILAVMMRERITTFTERFKDWSA